MTRASQKSYHHSTQEAINPRLHKLAVEKGWKLPAEGTTWPAHSWNIYWESCEKYELNKDAGRPVVPHRSA